jgi:hypothetical protein
VTFFTVLIAIGVVTFAGVAVIDNALSDHTKYGTVAFGSSAVLQMPAGDIAVAYGAYVEDTHYDHIVVPAGIGVQIVPVQSSTPAPVVRHDPADFYNERIGTAVNQAQRVWTVHVVLAGAYRVTPTGDDVPGELLLGHDAPVDSDAVIKIGVVLAAIDGAAWFLTSQIRRRSRRAHR